MNAQAYGPAHGPDRPCDSRRVGEFHADDYASYPKSRYGRFA